MRARPIASFIVGLALVNVLAAVIAEVLTTQLGWDEIHSVSAVAGLLGVGFIAFGVWLRNHHGGFAVLVGFIALICAVLFPVMYAARPELFPPG
ncbi:MAG: hypothetical protein ABL889_22025 [Terricaulis sp.]